MGIEVRRLTRKVWEPWVGKGYSKASSIMMVPKTQVNAVSCRIINLDSGGHTASHSHDRVHYVITIEGKAELVSENRKILMDQTKLIEIPSNTPHRFVNTSKERALIMVQNLFKT